MGTGIHAIYKPKGISSFDVIRKLQELFPGEKIGHGGTLDPLAEGVLVVAIGKNYTRELQPILKNTKKEYRAEITLGITSHTDDSEGPFTQNSIITEPSIESIKTTLNTFIGEIDQTPPLFSAVRINGKKAYKYARQGKTVDIPAKKVTIYNISLLDYTFPKLTIDVVCASGVYIRSLARDIGKVLETGAYMSALTRSAVGEFKLENAIILKDYTISK